MSLRDQRGITLVELLVSMTMALLLLGATLTTFDRFSHGVRENDARNDSAELARNAIDVQARQLRNLAKRLRTAVIDTIGPHDLIFQTDDPARTWVRYCLHTSGPQTSPGRGKLWKAELAVANAGLTAPVTPAMRSGCPGSGWTSVQVVVDHVTNLRAGLDRPTFSYECASGSDCTASAANYDQVIGVRPEIFLDTTPDAPPAELRLSSGVFLRNQNQAPVARFEWTPSASRSVVLNAAASSDFEGRSLRYYWFDKVLPAAANIDCAQPTATGSGSPRTLWGAAGFIGDGISRTHTFPLTDGVAGTPQHIGLVVCDPGDRHDTAGIAPRPLIAVPIPT